MYHHTVKTGNCVSAHNETRNCVSAHKKKLETVYRDTDSVQDYVSTHTKVRY